MSLAKILTCTERRRLAALLRYVRREGWEPCGTRSADGCGSWRNRRLDQYVDYGRQHHHRADPGDKMHLYCGYINGPYIGGAYVTSIGQAVDVLAALRIVPARFSNLYMAGATSITEQLVEAMSA